MVNASRVVVTNSPSRASFGAKAIEVPLRDWRHDLAAIGAAVTPRTKLVYVCSPNNPTGTANSEADVMAFIRALPDGATKTALQVAFDRLVDRLAHTLFNELPTHLAAQRRAS